MRVELLITLLGLAILSSSLWLVPESSATDPLPYDTRTKSYSGASTTIRGDIRTVGMAGATVGLADTFIASSDNPAGLAMTMNTGDLNLTSNWVHDNRIQDFESTLNTTNFGVALAPYPWGFSMGYLVPYRESQVYALPGGTLQPAELTTTLRDFRMSVARVFFKNRLSLGAALTVGQAEWQYLPNYGASAGTALHSYAFGATFGAMLQLPQRFLLGISYSLPLHFVGDINQQVPGVANFFEPIEVPRRFGTGVGWIPNRFFRADFTLQYYGPTDNTALLHDQTVAVGARPTFQPRLGAAYQFADYRDFSGTLFVGTYYESMRIQGAADRVHATAGIETKPWILTVGWGIDLSAGYSNYLVTAGIDIFKAMQKIDVIPIPWSPATGGAFPRANQASDEGLARPLVKNWKQRGPEIDPIQIGLDIPNKLKQKVMNAGKGIGKFTKDFVNGEGAEGAESADSASDSENDPPPEEAAPPKKRTPKKKKDE